MARSNLKPVSVAGIEFDALIDEQKTLSATIPVYPVEEGFPVSDTIILEPISISMTLYVTNTPVTWLYRHGTSNSRVNNICNRIENLWLSRQLVKIVTTDTVYKNMGLTSISITAQKVRVTSRKTASIPSYILKAGETMANAGTASTSTTSSSAGTASGSTGGSSGSSSSSGGSGGPSAKKNQSILYGVASGLGFI